MAYKPTPLEIKIAELVLVGSGRLYLPAELFDEVHRFISRSKAGLATPAEWELLESELSQIAGYPEMISRKMLEKALAK